MRPEAEDEMVGTGRRRARVRRIASVGGSTVAAALAVVVVIGASGYLGAPKRPATAAAHPSTSTSAPASSAMVNRDVAQCTIQQLPVPAGDGPVNVTAADVTTRYVIAIGNKYSVLWVDGQPGRIPAPPASDANTTVNSVNSHGEVVGTAASTHRVNGFPTNRPFVYREGASSLLPLPAGFAGGSATAINDAGDIVGFADKDDNDVAVLWPAAHPGTVRMLAAPHVQDGAEAYAITDDGLIGGTLGDGTTPYVWTSPTQGHTLAMPSGATGGVVNSFSGHFAGGSVGWPTSRTFSISARWDLATGKITTYPDYENGIIAIDLSGDIAVSRHVQEPAFLVRAGQDPQELPMPFAKPGDYPYPVEMSADGHLIVGQILDNFDTGDPNQPVVIWHC